MKKTIIISVSLISLVFVILISCNQSPYKGFKKSDSGFFYKYHIKSGDTAKVQLDDLLTLDIRWGTEDSNLFDSKTSPRPWIIPQAKPQYRGDIYEALSMMKVGDSMTFILPADSFFLVTVGSPMIPDFIDSSGMLFFDIKLITAQTQAEFDQAREQEDQKRMQDESRIIQEYVAQNNISVAPSEKGIYFMEKAAGNGTVAKEGEYTKVHFALSLLDGTPIYSSFNGDPRVVEYGKPFENEGVSEAIKLMSEGSRATVIVPSNLAFGKQGRGELIPPFTTLLYDLQVVEVLTAAEYKKDQERMELKRKQKEEANKLESKRFLDQNSKMDGVVTLPDGLQYKVITMGNGPKPGSTDVVKVHYRGTLIDGTEFDSSIKRGEPATFRVNGVIKGWTEALQMMPVGSKWILYIPSDLAYQNQQRGEFIEPYMALIFEVELLEIIKE